MFGNKNHKRKNSTLNIKAQERNQNQNNSPEKWDKLEQVDDVYCSDTFNIFNDIY